MFIRVRLIVTGACPSAYIGKQLEFEVPLQQPDDRRTTVGDLEAQVRREWPSELSEMSEAIKVVPVKLLRNGRLLQDTEVFEEQLTAGDVENCVVDPDAQANQNSDARGSEEEEKKSAVLMHFVVQREKTAQSSSPSNPHKKKKREQRPQGAGGQSNSPPTPSQNEQRSDQSGHRAVKDDSCCCVM